MSRIPTALELDCSPTEQKQLALTWYCSPNWWLFHHSRQVRVDMGGSGDFISIGFLTKRFLAIR